MFRSLLPSSPRGLGAWLAYAVILLTPGSFIVIPLLWLASRLKRRVPV